MRKFFRNTWDSVKTLKWYEWVMCVVMIVIAAWAMVDSFMNPSDGSNPPWLAIVNFVSAICGIMCIFLCAKANIYNFGFGIVNTVVYIVYLAYWKIYGTMLLEIFVYFPVNIISWIHWERHKDTELVTKSKKMKLWQDIVVAVLIAAATVVYHAVLVRWGGEVAWLDAATFAIGIVAVFLEWFRFREQYVWWIVTDVIAVAMYVAHFDPVYLTKKSIYLIMAVIGLYNWVKLNKKNDSNE